MDKENFIDERDFDQLLKMWIFSYTQEYLISWNKPSQMQKEEYGTSAWSHAVQGRMWEIISANLRPRTSNF